jgi:hypothetical protein
MGKNFLLQFWFSLDTDPYTTRAKNAGSGLKSLRIHNTSGNNAKTISIFEMNLFHKYLRINNRDPEEHNVFILYGKGGGRWEPYVRYSVTSV